MKLIGFRYNHSQIPRQQYPVDSTFIYAVLYRAICSTGLTCAKQLAIQPKSHWFSGQTGKRYWRYTLLAQRLASD